MCSIKYLVAVVVLRLTLADPILRPNSETTLLIPKDTTGGSRTIQTLILSPSLIPSKKELSICCCCMYEPQPIEDHYIAECPRKGVQAVCGNEPPGDPEYSLGGLEGQPEEIAKVCSSVKCGPVHFVD